MCNINSLKESPTNVLWRIKFSVFLLATLFSHSTLLAQTTKPRLASSSFSAGDDNVAVSASFNLRFSDPISPDSLDAIQLTESGKPNSRIATQASTDLTNASITISPKQFLLPGTSYTLAASTELVTRDGTRVEPFELHFRTASDPASNDRKTYFESKVFDSTRSMTTVLVGPDRKLYAASAFGEIVCWPLSDDGRPGKRRTLWQDPTNSRQFIDLELDPSSTPENVILWTSYAERLKPRDDPRRFFTGEIARIVVRNDQTLNFEVKVTGLPHGREVQGGHETLPHQPNGLCFHQGKLYQSVGSTSSSGGPANWGISEQPYSACILEIDYQQIVAPVDLKAGQDHRLIRRFATGIRNALEIVSHSNGRLYTAVNMNDRGSLSDGVPDDPRIPGDQNALIKQITPDHESLYILERGRHYGFPNPSIGNYVLAGGNPTKDEDPFEIEDYPIGTEPEPGFAPELMYPIWKWGGTSPNGMIEYEPDFNHPLKGCLLCCFYSANDIASMRLGSNGMPNEIRKLRSGKGKLHFSGPLDITQDYRTGSLYVSDFGKQSRFGEDGSLVWLRPTKAIQGK